MALLRLLTPAVARWLRRTQRELDLVPCPDDLPRRIAPGLEPDRVLLAGNGHVIGFGVRTHELSLTGQLARRLALRTGRGAVVDVVARRGLRLGEVVGRLSGLRLSAYDAVVLSLGATDAAGLLPPERWRHDLGVLLDELRAETSSGTVIAVLPVRPMQRSGISDGPGLRLAAAHAARLDRETAEVVAGRPDVVLLPLDPGADAARTPEAYLALADRIVDAVEDRLAMLAASPSTTTARAQRATPEPEVLRQAAVDRSGLAGTGSNAVLDRLLQQARDQFGVRFAAVALVDRDRVVQKAASGGEPDVLDRAVAPCNRTIRQEGVLVVDDLAGEPIAGSGHRFYAGYPLESPSGYRIGTLCILDDRPRPGGIDRIAFIELAGRVQAELWRQIQEGTDPGSPVVRPVPVPAP